MPWFTVAGWYADQQQTYLDEMEAPCLNDALLAACLKLDQDAVLVAALEHDEASPRGVAEAARYDEIYTRLSNMQDHANEKGSRSSLFRCEDCHKVYFDDESFKPLVDCENLAERLAGATGSPVPAGECTDTETGQVDSCGAFVYCVELDEIKEKLAERL